MKKIALLLSGVLFAVSYANAQIITTIAGTGTASYGGDGGMATAAHLYSPSGVAIDASGNIYTADYDNSRVRKVSPSGVISTFAGNGSAGWSGDGGAATAAELDGPSGVVLDGAGNVYIADSRSSTVRKVSVSGTITTIAGTGSWGYSGDGGAATAAQLNDPFSVAVDGSGNVYIADAGNHRIRKVATSGTIMTIAGTGSVGYSGDGGAATAAKLYYPYCIALDGGGNLYISDNGNNRIRKVGVSGTITTIVGTGSWSFGGDGGPATAAQLRWPYGIAFDGSGNLYIADASNSRIRKVDGSGGITTIAGTGSSSYGGDGGAATAAQLSSPEGLALDGTGNIYIADYYNQRLRKLTVCSRFAGTITGATYVLSGFTITLRDTVAGGTWSSSNTTMATIDASGVVYGISPGTVTIAYTISNACGDISSSTFIVNVIAPAAAGIISNTVSGIGIFPNPATKTVVLTISCESRHSEVLVTDLYGMVVRTLSFEQDKTEIDMSGLAPGVYLFKVTAGAKVFTEKVIMQ